MFKKNKIIKIYSEKSLPVKLLILFLTSEMRNKTYTEKINKRRSLTTSLFKT